MSTGKHLTLLPKRAHALERPQYEAETYVSAAHLNAGQRYRLERLWHHNRYLHGEGVVCGLQVVPARIAAAPWALRVCPGYAIGCCGEEIEVRSPALVDIREYLWDRPSENGQPARDALVAIVHAELLVKPQSASAAGCASEEPIHEPSRARDGYRLHVVWAANSELKAAFDLCVPAVASCPACADPAYVVLARVRLPEHESRAIDDDQIDNSARGRRFATSALQRQLLACCCDGES